MQHSNAQAGVTICLGGQRKRFPLDNELPAVEVAAAFSDRLYLVEPPDILFSEVVGDSHQVRANNGIFLARSFLPNREYHFDPPELRTPTGASTFGPHMTRHRLQLSLLMSMACYERDPVAFLTGRDYGVLNSFTWMGRAYNGDKVPYIIAFPDPTIQKSLSEIYIGFRGSQDLDDWKQNLYVAPKESAHSQTTAATSANGSDAEKQAQEVVGLDGSRFTLHGGYHHAASQIPLHLIRDAVQRRREQMGRQSVEGWDKRPITVILCGHSAGGAIAHTFHAKWLLAGGGEANSGGEGDEVSVVSIAYGSPYFACKALGDHFYRNMRGTSDRFMTICYNDDPVPRSLNLPENVQRYKSAVTSTLARFSGLFLGQSTSIMVAWASEFIPQLLRATSRNWNEWVKSMKETYHPLGRYIFVRAPRDPSGEHVITFETRPEEIRNMLGPAEVESAEDHDVVNVFRMLDRKGLIRVELNPELARIAMDARGSASTLAADMAPSYVRTDLLSPSIDRVWISEVKAPRKLKPLSTETPVVAPSAGEEPPGHGSGEDGGAGDPAEDSDGEDAVPAHKVLEVEIRGRSLDYLTGGVSVKTKSGLTTEEQTIPRPGVPFATAQAITDTAIVLLDKAKTRIFGGLVVKVILEKLTDDPIVLEVDEQRSTLESLVCRGRLTSPVTGDRMMGLVTLTTHFGETSFPLSDAMWIDGAKYDTASRLKTEFMVQLFYKAMERCFAASIFNWHESAELGSHLEKLESLCRKPTARSFKAILNELRVQHGTDGLEKVVQACQVPVVEIFEAMSAPLVVRKRMGTGEQFGMSTMGAISGAALGLLAVYLTPILVTIAPVMYLALGSSAAGGILGLLASRNYEYLNKEIRAREEAYRSTLESLAEEIGAIERPPMPSVPPAPPSMPPPPPPSDAFFPSWMGLTAAPQNARKRTKRSAEKLSAFQLEKLIWSKITDVVDVELTVEEIWHKCIFAPGGKLSDENVTDATVLDWFNRLKMVSYVHQIRESLLDTAFIAAIGPQKHGKTTALKQMYPNVPVEGAEYSVHTERLTFYDVPGASVKLVDFPGYTGVTGGGTGQKVSLKVAESLKRAMLNCSVLASVIICVFKFGNRIDEEMLEFADVIRPMSAFFPLLLCLNQASRYDGLLRSREELEEKRTEYITKLGLSRDSVVVTDFKLGNIDPPPEGAFSPEDEEVYRNMRLKVHNRLREIGVWSAADVRQWVDQQLLQSRQ
ncbi:hypothetical protein M427DRAFT_66364 [Gonapodya prolifera JEL478]|uniref:Fungal lipase-type domain-containing protein n=1 Tax=Gonapodya prolifera (strain JEL478) TaxID=1344416 RepID=A0A139AWS1_GONPJ|nr:hypothetical protein M427DRAFT_66364 [Gonapodya prolifera JEL478]|eukprot:KXS21033.1 hypothetical protein M427DRAFT_66364 [Gonapodya prolifera JEL478]